MTRTEHGLSYIDHPSIMHRVYPLVKLVWVVVVAIGLFIYREPMSGGVMLLVVLATATIFARVPLRTIILSSRLIFGLGLLLMVFHFFADPGAAVFRIGPLSITDGGLREGPVFFFRLSVVVLASFVLIWTTHPRDLMVSLSNAGIPYRFAFAVFLTMRFLPLIQREVNTVKSAHAIRGHAARSGVVRRIKLWQRYMFTVLVNGLRRAESTATAIDSRGFGAYPDRTYLKRVEFRPTDVLLVLVFVVVQAALVYAERLSS